MSQLPSFYQDLIKTRNAVTVYAIYSFIKLSESTMSIFWTFLASFLIANCMANAEDIGAQIFEKVNVNDRNTEIVRDEESDTLQRRHYGNEGHHIPCPCGWEKILNSCYLFVKNKVTWDTARQDCLQRGGDLVIPTSTSECVLLSQRASKLQLSIPWIGLFRRYDGKFYNTCGKALSFTRWSPNQPDDQGNREKCGHMRVNGKFKATWNDIPCDSKYSYICEFKQPRCD